MAQKRKTHSKEFKAPGAVEAIKGVRTLSELSAAHSVHPAVIAHWRRQLLEGAAEVVRRGPVGGIRSEGAVTVPLYQEMGRLKMELEWPQKTLSVPRETGCRWIHSEPTVGSIVQQCALAGLAGLTYSDEPVSDVGCRCNRQGPDTRIVPRDPSDERLFQFQRTGSFAEPEEFFFERPHQPFWIGVTLGVSVTGKRLRDA